MSYKNFGTDVQHEYERFALVFFKKILVSAVGLVLLWSVVVYETVIRWQVNRLLWETNI